MSEFGLDLIKKLKPVHFKYRDGKGEGAMRVHFGLIAQDINDVLPLEEFAIVTEKEGYYDVNYWQFISILIKAVQQLDTKVKELEDEIHSCKSR